MTGGVTEMQKLVGQQACPVTPSFRTTNLGELALELGLRPATSQFESKQRRFRARLLVLPRGTDARKLVGVPSAIGGVLGAALG